MAERLKRGILFRWTGWFAVANIPVLALVGLRYLGELDQVAGSALAVLYLVTAFVSHLAVLGALTLFIVIVPLVMIRPRLQPTLAVGVVLMAVLIAILTLDSLLWAQSRFHLNLLTANILGTSSWIFAGIMFLIALLFESLMARSVWRWVSASDQRHGALTATALGLSLMLAQGIHAWGDATYQSRITATPVHLPGYRGITAKSLLERAGLVDIAVSRERNLARDMSRDISRGASSALNYPLAPLRCDAPSGLNLLLIVVDSLRADAVSEAVTPHIAALADNATLFTQHYSGGNSSRIGLFSLLYALPPGYYNAVKALQRSAVLLDVLQRQGYQVGVFSSSSLVHPVALDRTAFAHVPDLPAFDEISDLHHTERVVITTNDWQAWVSGVTTEQPFFGFLYLDSSRKPSPPGTLPGEASPTERELADYRTAMRADDALVGSVIAQLRELDLLDQTVVLVTSDHGEEFGEHGDGIIGHGSSYSREQLQVPLVLHWPGRQPGVVDTRTSHYDVVPTLMRDLLGCQNPYSDYSSGANLFQRDGWDWLLVGSYYNYAVVEPDQVTITFPNGRFEVRDADYRLADVPHIRPEVMQAIIHENRRFHP